MTHPSIPALGALLLLGGLLPAGARAEALALPGCAVAHAAALHETGPHGAGFEADRPYVLLPALPGTVLHASHLHAEGGGQGVSHAVLAPAATAAAATLLLALSGHRDACPDAALRGAAMPLAQAIGHGGSAAFTWSGVAIRSGNTRLGARRVSLRMDGSGAAARVSIALDGGVSNDAAAGMLPDSLTVRASVPSDRLPDLLASSGSLSRPVQVTIEQLDARRGDTALSGEGRGTIAADPEDSSGEGHVTAHGLDTLLDAASASGLGRLRTALFLVKLVAHRQGDQADWDLALQHGVLSINNVPLPIR